MHESHQRLYLQVDRRLEKGRKAKNNEDLRTLVWTLPPLHVFFDPASIYRVPTTHVPNNQFIRTNKKGEEFLHSIHLYMWLKDFSLKLLSWHMLRVSQIPVQSKHFIRKSTTSSCSELGFEVPERSLLLR